ncbi:MAG: sensor histidine kinase [Chloroflexi bacterium]|nr:sensor histidine kinase [Chloroflexota bacterium]
MRTIGVYLIFAATALRGAVVTMDAPYLTTVLGLLAMYGGLLFFESWDSNNRPFGLFQSETARALYLFLQAGLVFALLAVSNLEDLFALLFIPLSLDAVTFFGRRVGYLSIAAFSLVMMVMFLFSDEGRLFGLAMGGLYSGMNFLFGGYASQVLDAEAAHNHNRRTYDDLQSAHRQLQGYTDQMANLAIEHERNRLARDLHDSVTQTVFSMNLTAQSARLLLGKDPSKVPAQLLHIEELASSALREIQTLVMQLKPRSLVEEGLPAALRRLVDERRARDDLQVSLEVHGDGSLSASVATGLMSIAQEALINVAKHSGVREATLRLQLDENRPFLEIEDNGRGFDPQTVSNPRGHLGLTGMTERAWEMGWRLAIFSKPGQGTRIRITKDSDGDPA